MRKKAKTKKIMLAAFDTETEGLNGAITKIGFTLDGKHVIETTPESFMQRLNGMAEMYDAEIYIYAHNLDFDIAKVAKYCGDLHFNPDKLLVINGAITRAAFVEYPNIIFCDTYKLVPSPLAEITDKFGLEAGKLKINYEKFGFNSKEEYFKHAQEVDADHFQIYWENDVKAVYQLLEKLMEENNLTSKDLIKCPTAPSLAMRIFKRECPDKAKLIGEQRTPWWLEDFFRMGYVGGRTEVFKPRLEAEGDRYGMHYDVNSLYPYVMKEHAYPVGVPSPIYDSTKAWQIYDDIKAGKSEYKVGMVHCKVYVPDDIQYPVLPFRTAEKLLFPVGTFTGVWCTPELIEAEKIGCKILEVHEAVYWKRTDYLFKDIIERWSKEKMNSTGARRESAKLKQNSLYGKFGMNRKRVSYKMFNKEEYKKMKDKGVKCAVIEIGGQEWIEYKANSHADYIHPEISAFITCYARLWLYRAIKIAQELKEDIYYCDTDSLVLSGELPECEVDVKVYGKFKLEKVIKRAVFIQPKLYAEITDCGKFIAKSKGLVKEYRERITYDSYMELYEAARTGDRKELYSGIEGRRKVLSSLKKGIDIDNPYFMRKGIDFSKEQKRTMLYDENSSKPVKVENGKWYCREKNGFMKAAEGMKANQYKAEKCMERIKQGDYHISQADKQKYYEEGLLLYRQNCGIITREELLKRSGKNAA